MWSPYPKGFDSTEKESEGQRGAALPRTSQKLCDSELIFLPSFTNRAMHNPPLNAGRDTGCRNVSLDPDMGPPQPSQRRLPGLC